MLIVSRYMTQFYALERLLLRRNTQLELVPNDHILVVEAVDLNATVYHLTRKQKLPTETLCSPGE
jgi:hypothetical protein